MNILFHIVPKNDVVFVYDDYSISQAMNELEKHSYTSVPVINRKGAYVGSLAEGDILWYLKEHDFQTAQLLDKVRIDRVKRRRDHQPVNINCNMEDLIQTAMNQNFIPVIDDDGIFIGIVTRKRIISHFAGIR